MSKKKRKCVKGNHVFGSTSTLGTFKNGTVHRWLTCVDCGNRKYIPRNQVDGVAVVLSPKELASSNEDYLTKKIQNKIKDKVEIKEQVKKKEFLPGKEFYYSRSWQEIRYKVLRSYERKCMCCFATNVRLHVDHIKPRSKYPELELEFSNLQILCEDCNLGKSNKDETDWRNEY